MSINEYQLRNDFMTLFITAIYQHEGIECDNEKDMIDRYFNDEKFNRKVADLVESSVDITKKHLNKAP